MIRTALIATAAVATVAASVFLYPASGSAEAQACDTAPQFAAHRTANTTIRAQYNAVSRGEWLQAIHFGNEVADSGASSSQKVAALTNLCFAYAATGEYDNAVQSCDAALERRDTAWRALNNRGAANWLAGNRAAAVADFHAAAAIEDGEDEVVANLALAQCS